MTNRLIKCEEQHFLPSHPKEPRRQRARVEGVCILQWGINRRYLFGVFARLNLSWERLSFLYFGRCTEGSAIILQPTRTRKAVETKQPRLIINRQPILNIEPHQRTCTISVNLRVYRERYPDFLTDQLLVVSLKWHFFLHSVYLFPFVPISTQPISWSYIRNTTPKILLE